MSKLHKYIMDPRVKSMFYQPNKLTFKFKNPRRQQGGDSGVIAENKEWVKMQDGTVAKINNAPTHDEGVLVKGNTAMPVKKGNGGVLINDIESVISATHELRDSSDFSYTYKDEEIKVKPEEAVEIASQFGFKISKPTKGISPAKLLDLTIAAKQEFLKKYKQEDTPTSLVGINAAKANSAIINSLPTDEELYDGIFSVQEGKKSSEQGSLMQTGGLPERYKKLGFTGVNQVKNAPQGDSHKKMVVAKKGDKYKLVKFGYRGMEDYTQHKDKDRRKNYLSRSAGIRNGSGQLTKDDVFSANHWSRKINWQTGGDIEYAQNGVVYKSDRPVPQLRLSKLERDRINQANQKRLFEERQPQLKQGNSTPITDKVRNIGYKIDRDKRINSRQDKANLLGLALSPVPVVGELYNAGNTIANTAVDLAQGEYVDALLSLPGSGLSEYLNPNITKRFRFIPTKEEIQNTFRKVRDPEMLSFNEDQLLRTVNNVGVLTKKNQLFNTDSFDSMTSSLRNLKKLQNKADKLSDDEFYKLTNKTKEDIPDYIDMLENKIAEHKLSSKKPSKPIRNSNQLPRPPIELFITEDFNFAPRQTLRGTDFDEDELEEAVNINTERRAGIYDSIMGNNRRENLTINPTYLNPTEPSGFINNFNTKRNTDSTEKQFIFDKPFNYIQRKLGNSFLPETGQIPETEYLLPSLFTDEFSNTNKALFEAKDKFLKMPKGSVAASASSLSSNSKPLELSMVNDFVSNKLADVNFHGYSNLNGLGFPELAGLKPELIKKQIDNKIFEINKNLDKKIPYSKIIGTEVSYPKISLTRKQQGGINFAQNGYTVKKGDTLFEIARDNNIPLETLVANNNIANKDKIEVGQKLTFRKSVNSSPQQRARTNTQIPVTNQQDNYVIPESQLVTNPIQRNAANYQPYTTIEEGIKSNITAKNAAKESSMINLKDHTFTSKDLEYLNNKANGYCPRGNCLQNTNKAFDMTAGAILGIPSSYDVASKDLKLSSVNGRPSRELIEKYSYFEGDRESGSADSWDIHGVIVNAGGKNLYSQAKGQKIPTDVPLGAIYGWGPANTTDSPESSRKKGYNTKFGLQPSHHSTKSVGFNEKGETILYDSYLGKYGTVDQISKELKQKLNYDLENISVPKSMFGFTRANLAKNNTLYNKLSTYNPDTEKLIEATKDPISIIKADGKPRVARVDRNSLNLFTKSLSDNKDKLVSVLGLSNDEYDRLSDIALSISMVESEGGGALGFEDRFGSTQGMTQLNLKNLTGDAKFKNALSKKYIGGSPTDIKNPAGSAIATMIYLSHASKQAEKLYNKGLTPGEKVFNMPSLIASFRASDAKLNNKGLFIEELNKRIPYTDIPGFVDKDYTKVNNYLKNLTNSDTYKFFDNKGKISLKMKTKGNNPNLTAAQKIAYMWQSPSTLSKGDAGGKSVYANRVNNYYNRLSTKNPQQATFQSGGFNVKSLLDKYLK